MKNTELEILIKREIQRYKDTVQENAELNDFTDVCKKYLIADAFETYMLDHFEDMVEDEEEEMLIAVRNFDAMVGFMLTDQESFNLSDEELEKYFDKIVWGAINEN